MAVDNWRRAENWRHELIVEDTICLIPYSFYLRRLTAGVGDVGLLINEAACVRIVCVDFCYRLYSLW